MTLGKGRGARSRDSEAEWAGGGDGRTAGQLHLSKDEGKVVCRESQGCSRDQKCLADSVLFPAPRTHCLSSAMEFGKVLEEGVSPLGRQGGVRLSTSETEEQGASPLGAVKESSPSTSPCPRSLANLGWPGDVTLLPRSAAPVQSRLHQHCFSILCF